MEKYIKIQSNPNEKFTHYTTDRGNFVDSFVSRRMDFTMYFFVFFI
jgi:hypothetical protein